MIISDPKKRNAINSAIDNFCVAPFYCMVPFAIVAGCIAGFWGRIFKK